MVDDPIPLLRRDQPAELVALADATAACVDVDQRVDLVATVEPDLVGIEMSVAQRPDHPVDVVAIDMGDDCQVEPDRSPRARQERAETVVIGRRQPPVDQQPPTSGSGPVLDDEAVATGGGEHRQLHRSIGRRRRRHRLLRRLRHRTPAIRSNRSRPGGTPISPVPNTTCRFAAARK